MLGKQEATTTQGKNKSVRWQQQEATTMRKEIRGSLTLKRNHEIMIANLQIKLVSIMLQFLP